MNYTILIVDDDMAINDMLVKYLRKNGYITYSAYSGTEALLFLEKQKVNLIILDLMLPGLSGEQVLAEIKKTKNVPVIGLSAKEDSKSKIFLLKNGADDYVTKPFDLDELIARVETNIRRSQNTYDVCLLKYKDLTLNTETKRTAINEIEIDLTAKEYSILELLLTHNGKVFTKANLYESIWGEDYLGDDNAVKAHISNIRSKLKSANPHEEYIETVWGLGYRLYKG